MKLRIKGDSIRLRLTQTELDTFAATGRVAETVHFPSGAAFVYALEASPDLDALTARWLGDALAVRLPRAWVDDWAASDTVGFDGAVAVGDGRYLALLVEKDFECLHKRPDEDDAFPHPLARSARVDRG